METATQSREPLVKLTQVSRVFETKSETVTALSEISLEIARGERIALLGRSGSGKSTLLNLLAGLDRPTSGQIEVDGKAISEFDSDQMASYRSQDIGIVFQAFNLISTKSAVENVELPFVFAGEDRRIRREKAKQALTLVGLADRLNHKPGELSGGEQQRVAVARSLVNQPSLILADEPTGNLDSATATEIMHQIATYADANLTTVVLVTHDERLADGFSHRMMRLHDGRLGP